MPNTEKYWWDFSLDPTIREDSGGARLHDERGNLLVNAPDRHGRQSLEYGQYLGLDRLLDAQTPSSVIPDERIFIVIHQLFELVFKQMTFDLGVIAQTLHQVFGFDDARFSSTCAEALPGEAGPSPFWRPAMTAAARLRHSARTVLPGVMAYVGRSENDDVLFSSIEYGFFRGFLAPASGFQSAQMRLIQRALGKTPYLSLRVFPGDSFGNHYAGCPVDHLAVGDPMVLRNDHRRTFPPQGSEATPVAELDDIAHAVLSRMGSALGYSAHTPPVRLIRKADIARAASRVRATQGTRADADAVTGRFRADLSEVATAENERRRGLEEARTAAHHLQDHKTCLTFVLDRLSETDTALHAEGTDSFLSVHRKTVKRHVSDDSGTGGGGLPYLITSQRFLLPLFPALVAFSDLRISGTEDHRDRW